MERKITRLRLVVLSVFLFIVQTTTYAQVYKHEFGTTTISTHPYTVVPTVINPYLTGSSWANSNSAWTSFNGAAGQAITMENTGGTKTITLSFNVAAGRQLAVTGFNFWRQRSGAGAQNWSMAINGTTVGTGLIPPSGAPLSATDPVAVSSPISGVTGTVNVVLTLTGATGAANGNVRLDDFALFGSVTQTCTPPVITNITPLSGPAGTVVTINGSGFQGGTGTSAVTFNGVAATNFTVVSATQIKATVPANATTGDILVITNSCEGIAPAFTVIKSDCPAPNIPTDLFISEVYDAEEGDPGAVEFYNGTSATINLAQYSLARYGFFDDTTPSFTVPLSGTLAPGQTYIARTSSAVCSFNGPPATQLTTGFNEDDKFELIKNGATVIDKVITPGNKGFTMIRNSNAVVPSATYNAADWNISNTEFCSNLGIHTINITASSQITSQPANDTVCENNPDTATFSITVSNATGVTYQWKMLNAAGAWVNVTNTTTFSGATTPTLTVTNAPASLNGTQFYCQVTLPTCSLISNAAILTVNPAPAVATIAPVVQPTCTTPTGTITITAPLGTGLTYSLNGTDFQSSPVFTAAPGSYFITVKNAAGCTSITTTATVVNPAPGGPAVATIAPVVQPTCTTATGTITITAPLGAGFTYSINGTDFQSSPVFTAAPGSYFITVKNTAGCTSITTTATVVNPAPGAPAVATIAPLVQPTCTTATGTITITAPLGTGFTYSINGTDFQSSPLFTAAPGSYFITVKNAAGCTSVTTTATVVNPAPGAPAVATIAPLVQPTCTTATGTITITAPLGTGFTYSINGTDFQTSAIFTAAPGSYFITVKNAEGCTSITTTATVVNTVPGAPAVATTDPVVQPTCTTPTGTITITAPLGTGLTYSLNGIDFQTSPVFTAAPGSYFITVQNADGCTSVTTTATVVNPIPVAPPVAIAALTPASCNAKGSINVTSPVGSAYTYSINGTTFQASPLFSNLDAGNYTITVTGAGGCTSQTGILTVTTTGGTIAIAASEGCEETIGGKHYILHALPQNGSFDTNDADYDWKNENGTVVSTDSAFDATAYVNNNQINTDDFPLQFTVTVTTSGGCSGTATYTVNGTFCDIPKGISPNNDGLNDNFDISGLNARKLSIYNRYGQEVYVRANYTNEWYGQSESGDLTSGTYFYVIELPNGTKTGWVYLNKEEN